MNNNQETHRSTIKGLLKHPPQTELNFTRKNLRKVEDQLKRAFVEFYQKLRLLKNYSFLNILAFSKIMKKYDKITSRNASKSYMKMVDNSSLGNSDEVTKLMERVEATFIKHFSNSNRTKGMKILRPKATRERHRTTFSTGFFAGCTVALILALILIIRARNNIDKPEATKYMENMFPLYSLLGFIVLHMMLYASNIYLWRRYQVNYFFIYGFKQGTELGYQKVFLLGFGLVVLALATVLLDLDMEMDQKTKDYGTFTELLPLNLVFVTLPDFFLADQFTSQVQALRSFEFYICYYVWGDFHHRKNRCEESKSRFLQCLRRLYEERDPMQGYNGIKYFLTIMAVILRTAYILDKGMGWKTLAGIFSAIAAIVATYWDLVIDWGLLQH
ncbi:hypothetical protein CMV_020640 [Castanea mollissima]|uniref:Uncharacterized protein n=1 Tax=Castanea mollissima TaxID=60419 RepID=A0A8J4QH99_9ROSI|nr:hypothetical protein CMV_020640 [Castanea mollissima]